jgi:hypothetical protein
VQAGLVEPLLLLEESAQQQVVVGAMPEANRSTGVIECLARVTCAIIHSGSKVEQAVAVAIFKITGKMSSLRLSFALTR